MDNERKELLRVNLRAMKNIRHKVGYGDDMRLAVSSDMMATLMSDPDARQDFNLTMKPFSEEWQGIPVNVDRRLDRDDNSEFEFSKIWTHSNQVKWDNMRFRPVLPTDKEVPDSVKD